MNRYYFKVNCFNDVALKVSNAVPENSKVKSNLVRVQQNSVVQSTEHIQCSSGPGLGLRTFKISRSVSNLGPDLRVQRCCESALRWIDQLHCHINSMYLSHISLIHKHWASFVSRIFTWFPTQYFLIKKTNNFPPNIDTFFFLQILSLVLNRLLTVISQFPVSALWAQVCYLPEWMQCERREGCGLL